MTSHRRLRRIKRACDAMWINIRWVEPMGTGRWQIWAHFLRQEEQMLASASTLRIALRRARDAAIHVGLERKVA